MSTKLATTHTIGDLATHESQAFDQNPAAVSLAGLSASSRWMMEGVLDAIVEMLAEGSDALFFHWARVRFQHVQTIRSKLEEKYAPSTTNRYLSAFRDALKSAWRLGQITAEEYHRAADVKSVSGENLRAGCSIPQGEIYALMNACANDQTAAGVRDAAIIAVLYAYGLRRAEIVQLNVADCDLETGALRVHGKRNKERLAYVLNGAMDALADWLIPRGDEPGALFLPIRRGGHIRRGG